MVMQAKDTSKPGPISNIEEKSLAIQRHACPTIGLLVSSYCKPRPISPTALLHEVRRMADVRANATTSDIVEVARKSVRFRPAFCPSRRQDFAKGPNGHVYFVD
jgi:hypothetical protein